MVLTNRGTGRGVKHFPKNDTRKSHKSFGRCSYPAYATGRYVSNNSFITIRCMLRDVGKRDEDRRTTGRTGWTTGRTDIRRT